jgi:hypothetical protein
VGRTQPGSKRPGRETGHSPLSSAKVTIVQSCTTSSIGLHVLSSLCLIKGGDRFSVHFYQICDSSNVGPVAIHWLCFRCIGLHGWECRGCWCHVPSFYRLCPFVAVNRDSAEGIATAEGESYLTLSLPNYFKPYVSDCDHFIIWQWVSPFRKDILPPFSGMKWTKLGSRLKCLREQNNAHRCEVLIE